LLAALALGPVLPQPAWSQANAALPDSPAPLALQAAALQASAAPAQPAPASQNPGQTISLDEALSRARSNEPTFQAAAAAARNAQLDRTIARSALLPGVVYHNQFVYTEGYRYVHPPTATQLAAAQASGFSPLPQTFAANNGVHEYVSQGSVTETLGLAGFNALSIANTGAAIASAELEISRRGLTVTVVTLFYQSLVAQARIGVEERALAEADKFVHQTEAREAAREAAHADVIKAQLTQQQRTRDLGDARLAAEKSRLDLAVLLFPDPRTPYTLSPPAGKPLESRSYFETAANAGNPEVRSALASLRQSTLEVAGAQTAYLPDLSFNFLYGIDANQFALNGRQSLGAPFNDATRNLGYAASATLDIPVFDWFATPSRIRQARNLRDAAKTVLSSTQRTLIAQFEEFYSEAQLADQQRASLDLSARTAAESLRLTELRYSAGEASVLDVVDAQSTLTAAELARTDGEVRYQVALANLQLLTGTL
jgi:outer membrane protein TolC